jgi:hypothetical protein
MLIIALLLQAAASPPPPDIELNARATVREVRIRQRGEASLQVRAGPDAGGDVRVEKPPANGRTRLRNVTVNVHAEARIADPRQNPPPAETTAPQ